MIKVSVVIPCYNSARFLDRCLDSVFDQTYKDLQIICVNDGSTDDTLKLLEGRQARHPELVLIDQRNSGANVSRNQGTERAIGEYIQYLDSDDVLRPDKIASQMDFVSNTKRPDLIIGSYEVISDKSEEGETIRMCVQDEPDADVWLKLMRTDLGITSANLFKTSAVSRAGGWNEALKSSQEYDLMFRILQMEESYAYHPMVLTEIHQQVHGSITSSNQGENWKRYIDLRLRIRDHVLKNKNTVDERALQQCLFDAIRLLYPYEKATAVRLFETEIPASFTPRVTQTTGKAYVLLFKLLGFEKTEFIRSSVNRWMNRKSGRT